MANKKPLIIDAGNSAELTASDDLYVLANIVVDGTVDGRDVATDGTKLDGIEANAKDDQTAAEVDVTPSGNLAATDVQAGLTELQGDIDTINTNKANLAAPALTGNATLDGDRVVSSPDVYKIDNITQAAYDALGTPDANTLYVIVG